MVLNQRTEVLTIPQWITGEYQLVLMNLTLLAKTWKLVLVLVVFHSTERYQLVQKALSSAVVKSLKLVLDVLQCSMEMYQLVLKVLFPPVVKILKLCRKETKNSSHWQFECMWTSSRTEQ